MKILDSIIPYDAEEERYITLIILILYIHMDNFLLYTTRFDKINICEISVFRNISEVELQHYYKRVYTNSKNHMAYQLKNAKQIQVRYKCVSNF